MTKISALGALGAAPASTDLVAVVDVSDTTQAATGTTKKVTVSELLASGTIAASIVDAKGDLIAATAADTVARVAVGANDTVLTADSTQAAGVKWATPRPKHAQFKTGRYYSSLCASISNLAAGQSVLTFAPFWVDEAVTLDRIGVQVGTLAASAVTRLGIYAEDGDGCPGALVAEYGTIDSSTTGFKELTISQALTPGLYFLAAANQAGSPTLIGNRGYMNQIGSSTSTNLLSNDNQHGWAQSGVTDALPASATTDAGISQTTRVVVRAA